jgi:hypothetical protein
MVLVPPATDHLPGKRSDKSDTVTGQKGCTTGAAQGKRRTTRFAKHKILYGEFNGTS